MVQSPCVILLISADAMIHTWGCWYLIGSPIWEEQGTAGIILLIWLCQHVKGGFSWFRPARQVAPRKCLDLSDTHCYTHWGQLSHNLFLWLVELYSWNFTSWLKPSLEACVDHRSGPQKGKVVFLLWAMCPKQSARAVFTIRPSKLIFLFLI